MRIVFVRSTGLYDDSRATKEILALAETGNDVTVLAWDRNGDSEEKCDCVFGMYARRIQAFFYRRAVPNGIGLKNLTKLFGFNYWIYSKLRSITEIDTVHICNLDAAIFAAQYCRRKGIRYVYDIYDYYVDSHEIPGFLRSAVERLEVAIINHSDATIICTEERREQISKAAPRKTVVIYNSPEVGCAEDLPISYDYVYCGSMGEKRLIREIFSLYPDNTDLRFITAGYGEFAATARELSERYENFHFLGSILYSQVLQAELSSAVIAAIYEPTIRNHRLCAPNKFYEALALSKPVIVCRGTGIDKVVEAHGIGLVIDYDAKQFYQALRYLCKNEEARRTMGIKARALYEEQYNWSLMKKRLNNLYR